LIVGDSRCTIRHAVARLSIEELVFANQFSQFDRVIAHSDTPECGASSGFLWFCMALFAGEGETDHLVGPVQRFRSFE
jgi:hypothetical protein